MPTDINRGFDDGDLLRNIRVDILNPVTVKVKDLGKRVDDVKSTAELAFNFVEVKHDEKLIEFHGVQGGGVANLTGMFREGSDLSVSNDTSVSETEVTRLRFKDSIVRPLSKGDVEVSYDWKSIVPANQDTLKVGTLTSSQVSTKFLFFKGAKVVHTPGDITTVDVTTPATNITATIPGGSPPVTTPTPITQIELDGDVSNSSISGDKLIINLKAGGGTPLANQNFLGFFESLGDIQSQVTNPVDGKSYAFAKDSKLGGNYYTPYFYVNGRWQELRKDPALTYEDPTAALPVGVFSVKPSAKIKVDANGQMDLDGLSTPQLPSHFKGFFETMAALEQAVPRPVIGQDWAYVRNSATGGLMAHRASMQGSEFKWNVIAPIGSFAVIDRSTTTPTYAQAFGVYKDNDWIVDSKGILSLKPVNTKTNAQIVDWAGNVTGGDFDTIQFRSGKSYVNLNKNKLFIDHPQQIIQYNTDFEDDHNSQDYEGNIFYDETSRTWMGWGIPAAAGGVDRKWTRIAHPKMSDEVKDLSKRLPAKSSSIQPGILEDSASWSYNGITYMEQGTEGLPEEIKNVCGGYITTSVQDKDAAGVTIPQYRMQTCTADRDEGGTWVRRWRMNGSPGASVEWSSWVRTSFSHKDIEGHEKDPSAHKSTIKYYRIFALTGKLTGILAQTAGGALGGLHADNGVPLADNYGFTTVAKDYLDVPYMGTYRVKGAISFSGYKEKKDTSLGKWQLVFRKKDRVTQQYSIIGQLIYVHTDPKKLFPTLSFRLDGITLEPDQELVTNLTFDNPQGLKNDHPDLYLVPSRSNMVLEDSGTFAGSAISNGLRLFYGNLDVIGDVGIKSHHSDLGRPDSQIRVYGEKVPKEPIAMTQIS